MRITSRLSRIEKALASEIERNRSKPTPHEVLQRTAQFMVDAHPQWQATQPEDVDRAEYGHIQKAIAYARGDWQRAEQLSRQYPAHLRYSPKETIERLAKRIREKRRAQGNLS